MKNIIKSRVLSLLAISTIGEGIFLILFTRKYLKIWRLGPRLFKNIIDFFVNRPLITKIIGTTYVGFGLWIGSKITDR